MAEKCLRCGRILKNPESIKLGYGKTCYRIIKLQETNKPEINNNIPQIDELLNKFNVMETKIQKLELDNTFMKCQLKHKTFSSKNVEDIERIKVDEARPERDENKVQFNDVVKELKDMLKSEEPILQKGFRFNNEELGITKPKIIVKSEEVVILKGFKFSNKELGITKPELTIINLNQIQMIEV